MFWVRDRHGRKREFHDADGYRSAMALSGPGSVMGMTWRGLDGDEDEVLSETPPREWEAAVEAVRERRRWIYLNGDCWHMALALRRLWGLPLCAVMNDGEGVRDGRRMSHVGARIPSGGFLDVRGYLATEEAFCAGTGAPGACGIQDVTVEDVRAELDHYADGDARDWENPVAHPFCAETEGVARLLFSGLMGPPMADEDLTHGEAEVAEIVRSLGGPMVAADAGTVAAAAGFVMEKWLERHDRMAEDHETAFGKKWDRTRPEDLSGSCKFSSLFVAACFGGTVRGNERHQFAVVDGEIVDLNAQAADVHGNPAAYRHDPAFFGNPDHLESLVSCVPRVKEWLREFSEAIRPRSGPGH